MSDLVSFDIQIEIIKKLPIISLIRFRSVSKPWKSLIDSSKFIHDNCLRENQPHHLLVSYYLDSVPKYVSIIDDDSFPQNKFSPTVPVTLNQPGIELGSSHGIICFFRSRVRDIIYNTDMAVLWNPTIRKSVRIDIPNMLYSPHGYTVFGFGVCPDTVDPKLLKITYIKSSITDWKVDMFTLSSGVWRTISVSMPFKKPVELFWGHVFVNGVIYWRSYDWIDDQLGFRIKQRNRIISFDLRSEEFDEVFLSDSLVSSPADLIVSKLMDSLVVIESYNKANDVYPYPYPIDDNVYPVCAVVWKMNHDVPKSFTKLYTVKPNDEAVSYRVLDFRKNGEPILEALDDHDSTILDVYDPCSGHVKDLELDETRGILTTCTVSSYTETLALLHHSDGIIY